MRTASVRIGENARAMAPTGRVLRLLSLMQQRPAWSGPELADRLGVTTRTVRRDVTRLRDLGYPVDADASPAGGYRLGRGAALPPLLLDDDEAVAVAVGLRVAADGTVSGLEEAAVAALAKLEPVLPSHLRERVESMHTSTIELLAPNAPQVDAGVLMTLAGACRRPERVRFTYMTASEYEDERTVEPFRLVHTSRRWYLVGRDVRRDGWRTFRLDRMTDVAATGHAFTRGETPDAAELVAEGMALAPYRLHATIRLPVPLSEARRYIARTFGVAEEEAGRPPATVVRFGGDSVEWMARVVAQLPFTVEVVDPPELRAAIRALGRRLVRANPPS